MLQIILIGIFIIFLIFIIRKYLKDADESYYYNNIYPIFKFDEVAKDRDYFLKTYGKDFFEWHTYKDWIKSGRKKRKN